MWYRTRGGRLFNISMSKLWGRDYRKVQTVQGTFHAICLPKMWIYGAVIKMGDVMVLLRVLPESVDIDLESLKNDITEKIKDLCKINSVNEEEIGFGLKALMFQVIVPDEEGKIDRVEGAISSVKNVSQVDTRDISLI